MSTFYCEVISFDLFSLLKHKRENTIRIMSEISQRVFFGVKNINLLLSKLP